MPDPQMASDEQTVTSVVESSVEDEYEIIDPADVEDEEESPSKAEPEPEPEVSSDDSTVGDQTPPVVPEIEEALLERAVKAGYSLREARAFTSPHLLESTLARLEAGNKEVGDDDSSKSQGEEQETGEDGLPKIPILSDEEFAPELLEWTKAMEARQAALINENRYLRQGFEQQSTEKQFQAFETALTGLGEDWHDVFGKDKGERATVGTDVNKNVNRLLVRMGSLEKEYQAAGLPVPQDFQSIVKEAAEGMFPQKIKAQTRRETASKLTKREKLITSEPTDRTKGDKGKQSPDKRAEAFVEKFYRERGSEDSLFEDDEDVEF